MPHFTVEKLESAKLHETWDVVRMAGFHPTLDWWLTEAEELIEAGGGVLLARAPGGAIHGVATYNPPGEQPANMLAVEFLTTVELNQSAPARCALWSELERTASALGCSGVALPLAINRPHPHSPRDSARTP